MKLGMTGSRNGMSDSAREMLIKFIDENNIIEAHHGDCVGADKEFHEICSSRQIKVIVHPPDDDKLRAFCEGDVILPKKAYIKRNHDIVDSCDILVAFPATKVEVMRSGTWATIRYAKKNSKKVIIY